MQPVRGEELTLSEIVVVNVGGEVEMQLTFGVARCPVCLRQFFVLLTGHEPLVSYQCDIGAVVTEGALCRVQAQPDEFSGKDEHVS